jgi:pimeloyl-ACP methyl ester carboxylesterase
MDGPRLLYLHGFTSGPGSKKGVAVSRRLAERGATVDRLDLRVPSIERLSFSRMCEVVRDAIGGPRDRAMLLGSSLGGLVAARVAEQDPRVFALVLLAPAFRFAERGRVRLGADWTRWMQTGWLETQDHATGGTARIHADFARELEHLDVGLPDVRVPTLIFHGIHDDVVSVDLSREFARARPHVKLVELDDDHNLLATLPTILEGIERYLDPITPTR